MNKFHAPTESQKAKDVALLAEIKRCRKEGNYSADDNDLDRQEQNTMKEENCE